MLTLETCIYAIMWDDILQRIDLTNISLQDVNKDLNTAVIELQSLIEFIEVKRDSFDYYEAEALKICINGTYKSLNMRIPRRNTRYDDGQAPDTIFSARDDFKIKSFLPVMDQLIASLKQRMKAYEETYSRFSFLSKLDTISVEELTNKATTLCQIYQDDIDENLKNELIQFRAIYRRFLHEKEKGISPESLMLKLIINKKLDNFKNVEIVLRVYLTILVTNCSGERVFSKLKLIKDRLSTSMTEDTLNERTVLNSEFDIARELDFSNLIDQFAEIKCRKVHLN